jgi:RNA polymerase sigma-70 factor (sigma-E family)
MGMSPVDETSFRQFAATRLAPLRRTAYLLCGDWHQADDLVQTALVKLYVAWPRLHGHAQLDGYTRRIVVRCYLDERRRPWRREQSTENVTDRPAAAVDYDDRLDLRDALAQLTKRQRATVLLRFWADASVAETADALGCSEGTVKSQTARALAVLRANLSDPALLLEEST